MNITNQLGVARFVNATNQHQITFCVWNVCPIQAKETAVSVINGHPNGEKQKAKGQLKTSASAENAEKLRAFVLSAESDRRKKDVSAAQYVYTNTANAWHSITVKKVVSRVNCFTIMINAGYAAPTRCPVRGFAPNTWICV